MTSPRLPLGRLIAHHEDTYSESSEGRVEVPVQLLTGHVDHPQVGYIVLRKVITKLVYIS